MDLTVTSRTHSVRSVLSGVFAAILIAGALALGGGVPTASAATITDVNQCNGTDNVGGQAVECTVKVTNHLDEATGVGSATVEIRDCHGAAGAPPTCITTITESDAPVTTVTQCDGSGNGGGGTVTCSVEIVNVVTSSGSGNPSGATVNQCITSGEGGGTAPTIVCDPVQSTTGATVTQCNGSGNGGGGTERVKCDVSPSVVTTFLPVTVDQCNGSGNGGGALVTCSTNIQFILLPVESPPIDATPPVVTPPVVTPPVVAPPVTPPVAAPPVVKPPVVAPPASPPAVKPPTTDTPKITELPHLGADTSVVPYALAFLIAGGLLMVIARRRQGVKLD